MARLVLKLVFGLLGLQPAGPTIMTKNELAELLKVKVADINKAIKIGQLVAGRHYFLVNGEVRFHISEELFSRIMDDCLQPGRIGKEIADKAQAKEPVRSAKKRTANNNQEFLAA